MINKKDLTGNKLKKSLNAYSVGYRWNNKNKGWGNFGINIYFGETFERGRDKELTGYYKEIEGEKIISSLSFGDLFQCGEQINLNEVLTYEDLILWIQTQLKNGENETFI